MTGNLRSRLAKLERVALAAMGGGRCALCWGQPCAILFIVHEIAATSIRKTGDAYLDHQCVGRLAA